MTRLRPALCAAAAALAIALATSAGPAALAAPPKAATHVVGTFDGSRLRLFVNGRLVAEQAFGGPVDETSAPVRIGSLAGKSSWYGTLDEVAVYDRALSPDTVRHHYLLGTGEEAGHYVTTVRSTPASRRTGI